MTKNYLPTKDNTITDNRFSIEDDTLFFNKINLTQLINKYETPLRVFYLPEIKNKIKKAKRLFNRAIEKNKYKGKYNFCYCTKCNYFPDIIKTALSEKVNLESSSAFDIDIIINLFEKGEIDTDRYIIHNGFKTKEYLAKIYELIKLGFHNTIIILDSKNELNKILKLDNNTIFNIGIRMSVSMKEDFSYSTSRFGINKNDIYDFFIHNIHNNKRLNCKMIHFFAESGIHNNEYYWGELNNAIEVFSQIKKIDTNMISLNIGGGFPIGLNEQEYDIICNKIIISIKDNSKKNNIGEPDLFTEFGNYTIAESGFSIYEVLENKIQDEDENWYIINASIMNDIPDIYSIGEKFPLKAINLLNKETITVNIGGLTCDSDDFYSQNKDEKSIRLPKINNDETLYIGIFNTGAYQDAIGGFGGINHCLIASPKYIIIDKKDDNIPVDYIYRKEQTAEEILSILNY